MNKILVKLYVPIIEEEYDLFIPANKKIYSVIVLCVKMINEFSGGIYMPRELPMLYNKMNGKSYDLNMTIKNTDIRNGSEIIMI